MAARPINPRPDAGPSVARAGNAKAPRKAEADTGVYLLAGVGGCLLLVVIAAGAAIAVWLALREDAAVVARARAAASVRDAAGGNPAFRDMADRLAERWVGELPQDGNITYEYRPDGTFTLEVRRPGGSFTAEGGWAVKGIGADSLSIERDTPAVPSEFLRTGDRPRILFPGPNLMQHTLDQTSIQFARAGSGVRPGQLPPPNDRQKAVRTLKSLGVDVQQDFGFDGRVRSIQFPDKDATDATLAWVKPLTDVAAVRLSGSAQVTDDGLENLAGLTQLEALNVDGTHVTDAGLVHLRKMQRLVGLDCGTPTIRGPGLVHLQGLPKLHSLSLERGAVTDAGLAPIAKLTNLGFVDLNDTAVTDAGLAHLHSLPNLKVVRLSRTKVTDAGIRALQKARPGLRVDE